jgi:pimeloyl-ACP methyl ester carboxylesterase
MLQSMVSSDHGKYYLRYTNAKRGAPGVLFIHGLGESGLSFKEALAAAELSAYSLYIPDLLGYGRSSLASSNDCGMDA